MTADEKPGLACAAVSISVPGRVLVNDLDIAIQAGEVLAVLGPNGVGKSLTLHTMAGLRSADSGSVALHGQLLADLS